jgi:hypothetical protein
MSDQIGHAFETREFAQLEELFTSGFACTLPDGAVLGREQFLTAFKTEAAQAIPPIQVSTSIRKLEVRGESALATSAEVTEYFVKNAGGSLHRLRYSQEFESRLVRMQRKWLIKAIRYPAHAKLWLDGEPNYGVTFRENGVHE